MKKSRRTEEEILGILKEAEAGEKIADLCNKYGMAESTFYNWKSKYSGIPIAEAQRQKLLESENAKLKKLLAERMLEIEALKDLLGHKR
jgi:putative transposase